MDFTSEIVYSKPYYKLVQTKSIGTTPDLYYKFINWIAGEFDLYLQDDSAGLKVYFPNGWINIETIDEFKTDINLQITIMNKSKAVCEKMNNQLGSIYNQITQKCRIQSTII